MISIGNSICQILTTFPYFVSQTELFDVEAVLARVGGSHLGYGKVVDIILDCWPLSYFDN